MATADDALALALSHALTLADCGTVVIGGGAVSEKWPDPGDVHERVAKLVHPQVRIEEVAISTLPQTALLGAALQAFDLLRAVGEDQ